MASNFNQVTLIGRLTSDPKIQYTSQKVSYVRATIAIDRQAYFANKQAAVDFINITIWNQNAEYIGKYGKKGHLVFVLGELRNNNFLNPTTNQQVYRTEVNVNRIDILTPPANNGGGSASKSNNNNTNTPNVQQPLNNNQLNYNDSFESSNNTNIDYGNLGDDDEDDYGNIDWDNPDKI